MKTVTSWWGWRVPVLGVAALVLLGSGLAAGLLASNALASSGGNTLFACVGERSGSMRLVEGGGDCVRGEELVSWNVQGPTGAPGPNGATGAQGPQGATGATGAQGEQGDQGERGPIGLQGEPGISGLEVQQGPIERTLNPDESSFAFLICETGTRAFSGGASVPDGILIESSFINLDGVAFTVKLRNTTDETVLLNANNATLLVVCAEVEEPRPE